MNLSEAVKIVIEQNKSVGFNPSEFIRITMGKSDIELKEVIKNIILKAKLLEHLEKQIDKYGEVLSIEDLVALEEGYFLFSDDVVIQAKARSEYFNQLRETDNDWINNFFK